MLDRAKSEAIDWIEKNRARLVEVSDAVWGFAELGFVEFKSSKLVADELEKHGFSVKRGVASIPTAFVAECGSGKPVIGIMGEYDALPGISQKTVPYKEALVPGAPGHGCGHNIHGVSGLGAALALKVTMEKEGTRGTLKYFGCPAEEMLSGKVWMVRDGVFEGVDACLSHHPSGYNTAQVHSSNANVSVKFHFYGKTSHAAGSPEQGRSALDGVELMNIGVNYLREHVIEKARIHYVIEDGGGQPNVVPDYARVWYMIRAPERNQVDELYKRVLKIAEGAALMTDTTHRVDFQKAASNKIPSKALSEIVVANMKEIGAPVFTEEELAFAKRIGESIPRSEKMDGLAKSKMPNWERFADVDLVSEVLDPWADEEVGAGSTDVSDVSWNTPTMEFGTAASVLGTPGHSWQNVACSGMSIGHKSLIFASKVIAASALDLFTKPELLKEAKDELEKRLHGIKYTSPVPPEAKPPLNQWTGSK